MKKLSFNLPITIGITLYLISLIPITLFSQAPQKIDFQAIARDAEGIPIASQAIGVKISIVKDSIGGEVVYEQADTITTDISGLFTLKIGDGNAITGNISEIDWGSSSYYTQVSVDKDGGTNYIDMGTMEMVSVPYALYSERSGSSYWEKTGTSIFYNNGRIGIGTINPLGLLSIKSTIQDEHTYLVIDRDTSIAKWNMLSYKTNGKSMWGIGVYGAETGGNSGANFYIRRYDDSGGFLENPFFIKRSNGYIGIGTTNPTQRLDVSGNARIRSIGSGASAGYLTRTSDGTLTTQSSDIRMKMDIQPLKNSLEKAIQLQGVSFKWIDDPELGQRIGMIAQEVEKILPELVFTNNVDGYKGINYVELTAVLVEAIKEQQQTISEQQKQIDDLINKFSEFEQSK